MAVSRREIGKMEAVEKEWLPEFTSAADVVQSATPAGVAKEGYYGIPMLKRPTWGWEIAWYFYLGGISAGSFVLASLADLSKRRRLRPLVKAGYYTSFLSLLPCPPLLIIDLGDPSRFHHMLRVFKPTSPMNLGAWALTAYSLPLSLLAGANAASRLTPTFNSLEVSRNRLPSRLLGLLGIPPALVMLSYPGALLSMTSMPIWSKSRLLGAVFVCSSFANAVAATSLALALGGRHNNESLKRLGKIESTARIVEAAALGGFLVTSGKTAKPLMQGRHGWQFWLGAVGAGLLLPTVVEARTARRRWPSLATAILRSAFSLAGGFALKWVIAQAGKASAEDAGTSREATRPSRSAPGWSRTTSKNREE